MGPAVEKRVSRRRIAIACNSCRERKSRCDGAKPICSPCQRRSLPLSHCVYHVDNATTQSIDAYIASLHDRIRQLEGQRGPNTATSTEITHTNGSIDDTDTNSLDYDTAALLTRSEPEASDVVMSGLDRISATTTGPMRMPHTTAQTPAATSPPSQENATSTSSFPRSPLRTPYSQYESIGPGSVTGMGDMASGIEDEVTTNSGKDYFGSSSTASLMHIAHSSVKSKCSPRPYSSPSITSPVSATIRRNSSRLQKPMRADLAADICLPSRQLADHLLDRYWERVHIIYPFVHRPSFQSAYRRLWQSSGPDEVSHDTLDVGLGSSADGGPNSAAFHTALNVMFAMGCQFSDMPATESASMAQKFFLRSKRFVDLDFLDENNLAVVQALLIRALFLQSTHYSSRWWISVGLACRVAQGIGLHTDLVAPTLSFWETEMRRRVWHGCVMMDSIVSMLLGRPVMLSQPSDVPAPSTLEEDQMPLPEDSTAPQTGIHSRMLFYVKAIELSQISERVLSTVYQPWMDASSSAASKNGPTWKTFRSMDAITELEKELAVFESSLPQCLSWTESDAMQTSLEAGIRETHQRQSCILHSRFLHLRLMLYRPILTNLCQERETNSINIGTSSSGSSSISSSTFLHFATTCASTCVTTAQNLVELVHSTYRTPSTGAWWYNGLYASTAGLVLILARICPSLFEYFKPTQLQESFRLCEDVLENLASFSVSAHNTLSLLRKMKRELDNEQHHPASDRQHTAYSAPSQTIFEGGMEGSSGFSNGNTGLLDVGLDGLSALHSSFFDWDPALEFIPNDLYTIISALVTPPA